ncbi:unnamed protein product [Sphenostylis stenocarpa]|uniref:Uncharacterized protein n=1 Tax=Sphenostylis stenocarpa TaxID=92480 RepID=A0AA86W6P2_9FABA|nr:unnamed protein product [Sphenostylis stenocarpa]
MKTKTYSILILPPSISMFIATSTRHGNGVKRLKAMNEKKGFANALGERIQIAGSVGFQGEWIRREKKRDEIHGREILQKHTIEFCHRIHSSLSKIPPCRVEVAMHTAVLKWIKSQPKSQ